MATIKSFTDIEQSKKLAEILPLESADMHSEAIDIDGDRVFIVVCGPGDKNKPNYGSSCWSLAALLNVLDYPQLSKDKLGSGKMGWMVSVYPNDCRYDSCWFDNPIDACYEMVIRLHELNLL